MNFMFERYVQCSSKTMAETRQRNVNTKWKLVHTWICCWKKYAIYKNGKLFVNILENRTLVAAVMDNTVSIVAQTMTSSRSSVDSVISIVKTFGNFQRMKLCKTHNMAWINLDVHMCGVRELLQIKHLLRIRSASFVLPLMMFKLTIKS